jgi:dTDP-4-amino-4,6-dideoxygalactose transaminase
MQAAILRVRLPSLDSANAHRQQLAARYLETLAHSGLKLPAVRPGVGHVWHQFVVRTPSRDDLRAKLMDEEIATATLYPVPIHHQPAYLDLGSILPVSERACREVLCLPCHPALSAEDIDRVCSVILR